jgi:sec-independent protein translocase protein TatC
VVSAPDPEDGQQVMTVVEHLAELRRRLFVCIVAVVIGGVVGWYAVPQVITILSAPIPGPLVFITPGGAFFLYFKIALIVGLALALPVILYELWAFVSPGLTAAERRGIRPWVPLSLIFFALGMAVAYLTLPLAASFLLSFAIPGLLQPLITAESYFGFVTTMFLAFGLVMQFPFVILLLSKVGIVTVDQLRHNRRYVFLAIAVFAVVITPGGDPISPTIMALVMYPLYELTIRLVSRQNAPKPSATPVGAE